MDSKPPTNITMLIDSIPAFQSRGGLKTTQASALVHQQGIFAVLRGQLGSRLNKKRLPARGAVMFCFIKHVANQNPETRGTLTYLMNGCLYPKVYGDFVT